MPSLFRRSLAELVGTFALVFVGAGTVAAQVMPGGNTGLLGIALAHGLVLAVMVSATMGISGGHLNPAVTLGLVVARRTELRTAAAYIAAQLLGACC
jgi:glycerol uptake facilitator-like aquaporin